MLADDNPGRLKMLSLLIEEVFARHLPQPPASGEQIIECETRLGYQLPLDLKLFYQKCNGARLFGENYVYRIMPLEQIERISLSTPPSWHSIVDLRDGNYIGVDLATVNGDSCLIIDCDHETLSSASGNEVVALSFTEFLQRALKGGTEPSEDDWAPYWFDDGFTGYGHALALRAHDPDIQAFLQEQERLEQMRHDAIWKTLWRKHGWDPDRVE